MKRALICGISGQDGGYLARLLLDKGYQVVGTSRDAEMSRFDNLSTLEIRDRVECRSMTLTDFRSVLQVLSEVNPDEIYNLAGQSSVGLSFNQPVETLESIANGTLNLLEAIRFVKRPTRLYNAASGECFGETKASMPASESSPFRPRSPYGVAKAAAFWEVANYREAYGLYACSGILFNHESSLRPSRFVTRKIIRAACQIGTGHDEHLSLGAIDVKRDWGWAPEYVEAMWLMLQQKEARDFVIATGSTYSLRDFISDAFSKVGRNWQEHVSIDQTLYRASEINESHADPSLAAAELGWSARTHMGDLVSILIDEELARISTR